MLANCILSKMVSITSQVAIGGKAIYNNIYCSCKCYLVYDLCSIVLLYRMLY